MHNVNGNVKNHDTRINIDYYFACNINNTI